MTQMKTYIRELLEDIIKHNPHALQTTRLQYYVDYLASHLNYGEVEHKPTADGFAVRTMEMLQTGVGDCLDFTNALAFLSVMEDIHVQELYFAMQNSKGQKVEHAANLYPHLFGMESKVIDMTNIFGCYEYGETETLWKWNRSTLERYTRFYQEDCGKMLKLPRVKKDCSPFFLVTDHYKNSQGGNFNKLYKSIMHCTHGEWGKPLPLAEM